MADGRVLYANSVILAQDLLELLPLLTPPPAWPFVSGGGGGGPGPQGPAGPAGSGGGGAGTQGQQGFQGTNPGVQGPQGNLGIQGPQGNIGVQGPQGSQGQIGVQGNQGLQGAQGLTGAGVQGPQGFQGIDGTQGFQGFQGTGVQGPQGNQGPQGFQGFQGFQGLTGAGVQGPQGFQGTHGFQSGGALLAWGGTESVAATDYFNAWGPSTAVNAGLISNLRRMILINRPGTLRNFRVRRLSFGVGLAATVTVHVNGVATAITVSLAAGVDTGGDTVNSVAVVAGDFVEIERTGTPGTIEWTLSLGFD